jgi:hypothetical protein
VVSLSLPAPYPGGKSPRYPLGSSLSGAQNRSAVLEKRKSLAPAGIRCTIPLHPSSFMACSLRTRTCIFVLLLRILIPSPHKFAQTSNKLLFSRESIRARHVMYNKYSIRSPGILCGVGLYVNAFQES